MADENAPKLPETLFDQRCKALTAAGSFPPRLVKQGIVESNGRSHISSYFLSHHLQHQTLQVMRLRHSKQYRMIERLRPSLEHPQVPTGFEGSLGHNLQQVRLAHMVRA